MSDTPVTLYRPETSQSGWTIVYLPVGEFVSRPWCATHDEPLSVVMEPNTDGGLRCYEWLNSPKRLCKPTDRLVQVIPDDH